MSEPARHFTRSLQENLLILLCFSEHASTLSHMVDEDLFDPPYRLIAGRALKYIREFKVAPDNHIPDLLEEELSGSDSEQITQTLYNLYESRTSANFDFVVSKLRHFKTTQALRSGIIEAAEALHYDTPTAYEQAETILADVLKQQHRQFEPGMFLGDPSAIHCIDKLSDNTMQTGITELDSRRLGPARKELHLFVAPQNRGKSWWLVQFGKQGILDRLKVCHITLEMSQEHVIKRYFQCLFAIRNRQVDPMITELEVGDSGELRGFGRVSAKSKLDFADEDFRQRIQSRLRRYGPRMNNLVVKEFPTRGLSVRELDGYLEYLDQVTGFAPDVLIIDYADLMNVDTKNYRIEIGALYQELRGIAVNRNLAIVTASQANREGSRSKFLHEAHISEDFSKLHTADTVIAYSQTDQEHGLGLARLNVIKSRNHEARSVALIVQNYAMGQFCLQSFSMPDGYWGVIGGTANSSTPAHKKTESS